jgi:alpha-D-xyloside xylohydrolase
MGDGNTVYGDSIKNLKLSVIYESNDYVHVKITDADQTRWEVPESMVSRPSVTSKAASPQYTLEYTESPFSFEVFRKSDSVSVFKFSSELMFKDQYLEFSTPFDSRAKTFGIGESTRTHHALNSGSTFTLWARDEPAAVLDVNLYGSFPYYLQLLDGKAHGAMLLNSNGMDVRLYDDSIKWSVIGGVIDLYVFSGSSPADVVKQYTDVVGRPAMQPYWSFGFHNCKYGYTSVYEVEDIVQKYKDAKIPLDTQWMDIDYMEAYRDFTTDSSNFPAAETKKFVDQLHADGMKFVPIIDPGIMVFSGYEAYEDGMKEGVFVKDISGGYYLGQVWPGPTYFPDFFHPSSTAYWTKQLQTFYDIVPVDGLWIDMNEVSNFCNDNGAGQVCENSRSEGCPAPGASQTDCCLVCSTVDGSNSYDFPPYNINNVGGLLSVKTMAMSASHYGNVSVYDAHNLYGLSEQIATKAALETIRGERPFIVSRSSFLGTGVHSAKWTGDNGED